MTWATNDAVARARRGSLVRRTYELADRERSLASQASRGALWAVLASITMRFASVLVATRRTMRPLVTHARSPFRPMPSPFRDRTAGRPTDLPATGARGHRRGRMARRRRSRRRG